MELKTNGQRSMDVGRICIQQVRSICNKRRRYGSGSFSKIHRKEIKKISNNRGTKDLEMDSSPKRKCQRNQQEPKICPKDRILKIGFSWKTQSIKEIEKKPQNHPENPDPGIGFSPEPRNRRSKVQKTGFLDLGFLQTMILCNKTTRNATPKIQEIKTEIYQRTGKEDNKYLARSIASKAQSNNSEEKG